jgi:hypothetical protein
MQKQESIWGDSSMLELQAPMEAGLAGVYLQVLS